MELSKIYFCILYTTKKKLLNSLVGSNPTFANSIGATLEQRNYLGGMDDTIVFQKLYYKKTPVHTGPRSCLILLFKVLRPLWLTKVSSSH